MEPSEAEIDRLLRLSMAAPIPSLTAGFDARVACAVGRSPRRLGRYGRILLIGYAVLSVVTCAVVMRDQGLDWRMIAATTVGPLVLVAAVAWARGSIQTTGAKLA